MNLVQLAIMSGCVLAAISAVMAGAWRIQQVSGNFGWVDVSWTFGVGGIAFLAALVPLGQDFWPHWRQLVVALLAATWSLRLGLHIAMRTRASGDDPRYRQLATQWQSAAPRRMFWFLQKQAAVGFILVMSVALAAQNHNSLLRLQDLIGILVLVIAIVGEAVSDAQLRVFRSNHPSHHAICDVGLWRWSRHPNYFFEWLAWLAYPLLAIDISGQSPWGWLALFAPACMYWVLVHVSGIPPLESHMLRSRGDAFRAYQRRTRPFLPFPLIRQRSQPG
jgi:steroid 5-alpha reductase family enzyme